ncbi:universal stress protein [Polaribacter sp. Z014]|uniref:universal stress protein n=1 Tax=unclassified Polaribacter TaxID=196858 RepID=UPI00193C70B1|nr:MULTISPECIES: universal stress protein [unclassified Polaribacter]MCL7764359.1 universal stress protein [Polaribacter sp. Z014]QVY67378.1 universal stress protein [Polaribacter sp. Q13]
MKKIIVPIDFSKYSEFALKTAALLAKKYNATVYAMHMLDMQEVSLTESEDNQQEKAIFFLKLAEKKFKDFLKKDYLEGIKIIPIIKHFKVFSEINEIAEEIKADLIIMGSQGTGGVKGFFIGSNTEKVVRFSNLPVLVIKNEMVNADFSDIVVATDFSEESIPAFNRMLKALDFLNAQKHILYVNLPNEEFKTTTEMERMANNFLLKAEGDVHRMINVNYVCDRTIEKGILSFSNAVGADLISVITHGRQGLSHIFAGSVAEDVANHSTLPIITIKI